MKKRLGSLTVKRAIIWATTLMMSVTPAAGSLGTITVHAEEENKESGITTAKTIENSEVESIKENIKTANNNVEQANQHITNENTTTENAKQNISENIEKVNESVEKTFEANQNANDKKNNVNQINNSIQNESILSVKDKAEEANEKANDSKEEVKKAEEAYQEAQKEYEEAERKAKEAEKLAKEYREQATLEATTAIEAAQKAKEDAQLLKDKMEKLKSESEKALEIAEKEKQNAEKVSEDADAQLNQAKQNEEVAKQNLQTAENILDEAKQNKDILTEKYNDAKEVNDEAFANKKEAEETAKEFEATVYAEAKKAEEAAKEAKKTAKEDVDDAEKKLETANDKVESAEKKLEQAQKEYNKKVEAQEQAGIKKNQTQKGYQEKKDAQKEVKESFDQAKEALKQATSTLKEASDSLNEAKKAFDEKDGKETGTAVNAKNEAQDNVSNITEQITQLETTIDVVVKNKIEIQTKLEELNNQYQKMLGTGNERDEALNELNSQIKAYDNALEALKNADAELSQAKETLEKANSSLKQLENSYNESINTTLKKAVLDYQKKNDENSEATIEEKNASREEMLKNILIYYRDNNDDLETEDEKSDIKDIKIIENTDKYETFELTFENGDKAYYILALGIGENGFEFYEAKEVDKAKLVTTENGIADSQKNAIASINNIIKNYENDDQYANASVEVNYTHVSGLFKKADYIESIERYSDHNNFCEHYIIFTEDGYEVNARKVKYHSGYNNYEYYIIKNGQKQIINRKNTKVYYMIRDEYNCLSEDNQKLYISDSKKFTDTEGDINNQITNWIKTESKNNFSVQGYSYQVDIYQSYQEIEKNDDQVDITYQLNSEIYTTWKSYVAAQTKANTAATELAEKQKNKEYAFGKEKSAFENYQTSKSIYDQKNKEYADLSNKLEEYKKKYEDIKDTDQVEIDGKKYTYEELVDKKDKAKEELATAKETLIAAESAYEDAKRATSEAKEQYDAALLVKNESNNLCEQEAEKYQSAKSETEKAKKQYDLAKDESDKAKKETKTAKDKLDSAKNKLISAQKKQEKEQSKLEKANRVYQEACTKYQNALAEKNTQKEVLDQLKKERDDKEKIYNQAKVDYKEAKEEKTKAENNVKNAEKEVKTLLNTYEAKKTALEDADVAYQEAMNSLYGKNTEYENALNKTNEANDLVKNAKELSDEADKAFENAMDLVKKIDELGEVDIMSEELVEAKCNLYGWSVIDGVKVPYDSDFNGVKENNGAIDYYVAARNAAKEAQDLADRTKEEANNMWAEYQKNIENEMLERNQKQSNSSSRSSSKSKSYKTTSNVITNDKSDSSKLVSIEDEQTALAAAIPGFIPYSMDCIYTTTATGDVILIDGSAVSNGVVILVSSTIVLGDGTVLSEQGKILGYVIEETPVMTADAEVYKFFSNINKIILGSREYSELSEEQVEVLTQKIKAGENIILEFVSIEDYL